MDNTERIRDTSNPNYCKTCKTVRDKKHFEVFKSGKRFKMCDICRERRARQRRRDHTPLRSERKCRTVRERNAPDTFGGNKYYTDMLKKPWSEMCKEEYQN